MTAKVVSTELDNGDTKYLVNSEKISKAFAIEILYV